MGTPEFAVASLDALIKHNFNIVAVVTSPDKPAGRGQAMHESAVKKYALEQGLKILQPLNLKDENFIAELKSLQADVQIVVAFRMLPEQVWNMPKMGTYNLHASLLPRYRGAAPINWAIMNGETETGVTTFKLKHEIDTGNILFYEKVVIGANTTAGELHDRLMNTGAQLIVKTAEAIELAFEGKQDLNFLPQIDTLACHAPKIFKETCKINWNYEAVPIYNQIRGLSPYPAAFTEMVLDTGVVMMLKIFAANYVNEQHTHTNGSFLTDEKSFLKVYCKNGYLELNDIQLQGKKRMPVTDFLRGFKLKSLAHFS